VEFLLLYATFRWCFGNEAPGWRVPEAYPGLAEMKPRVGESPKPTRGWGYGVVSTERNQERASGVASKAGLSMREMWAASPGVPGVR